MKVDLNDIKKEIDKNTICLFASAPDYGFGIYEDIPAISKIA